MPLVEFLPEGPDDAAPEPRSRPPRTGVTRRVLAVATGLALVVAAAVVVATNGTTPRHAAAIASPSPSRSASASPAPSVTHPTTLSLPESVAFGPQAVDVLADGNRVFALTPTLVGIADRDGGTVTVRPAPLGLSNQTGQPQFVADLTNRLVWVVAIGGTAVGAYDSDHLDALANTVSPYPIRGAVAMDEKLYLTTDHGLYSAEAGPGRPKRIAGPNGSLGAVAVNQNSHEVLAIVAGSPSRLHVLTSYGGHMSAELPTGHGDTMTFSGRAIWVTGHSRGAATLFSINPATLRISLISPLDPQLGRRAAIVGDYDNRLLVYSPSTSALYCVSAFTGAFKQKWTVPTGTAALNERGLLVATKSGIEQLNARDCLAG
jgi:hypothetical protein